MAQPMAVRRITATASPKSQREDYTKYKQPLQKQDNYAKSTNFHICTQGVPLLIAYETEIVTAITIGLIGAILTGYIFILKKNGWLDKTSFETGLKGNVFQDQPELKTQNPPTLLIETKASTHKQENEETKTLNTDSPIDKPKENKTPQRKTHKKAADESQIDKPAGCNYHFGYLWTLPKGTATPEECYCCTKLIECYKETKN
jgi:hypothetical protein